MEFWNFLLLHINFWIHLSLDNMNFVIIIRARVCVCNDLINISIKSVI